MTWNKKIARNCLWPDRVTIEQIDIRGNPNEK